MEMGYIPQTVAEASPCGACNDSRMSAVIGSRDSGWRGREPVGLRLARNR